MRRPRPGRPAGAPARRGPPAGPAARPRGRPASGRAVRQGRRPPTTRPRRRVPPRTVPPRRRAPLREPPVPEPPRPPRARPPRAPAAPMPLGTTPARPSTSPRTHPKPEPGPNPNHNPNPNPEAGRAPHRMPTLTTAPGTTAPGTTAPGTTPPETTTETTATGTMATGTPGPETTAPGTPGHEATAPEATAPLTSTRPRPVTPTRQEARSERRARRRPATPGRLRRLPHVPPARGPDRAQGDGPHAGPPGPDVRGRLPRLGPAHRRRREVRAEGGRGPGASGPPHLPARPGRRAPALPARAAGHPDRPRRGRGRPGAGRGPVLRPRRDGRRRPRLAHGRVGLRQQVLPPRLPAHRRPAPRLRTAHAAHRRVGGDGCRHRLAGRHPRRLRVVVAALADHRRVRLLRRRARRTPAPALR